DHDTTIFEPHPPSHKQFSLTTETRSGFAARYAGLRPATRPAKRLRRSIRGPAARYSTSMKGELRSLFFAARACADADAGAGAPC
ncbi:hypothetical protein, partial [Rathayibacter sp. PhB152]|uniref:hypothetical protein n=1 Tax=Rathayibacter sp. PhB152 TaxID=2485190 RepID=UPI001C861116